MVYKKDLWIATYKKAVVDLKTDKPTGGLPCAIASIRYLRDGLVADLGGVLKAEDLDTIKESLNELLKAVAKDGVDDGFLSNASAAAKAAGFKASATAIAELVE